MAAFVLIVSGTVQAVEFSPIGRDAAGKVLDTLDQVEAHAYCARHGMALPTLEQLLIYAQQNGACGPLSVGASPQCAPSQYLAVPSTHFLYSPTGYSCPDGTLAHSYFWSRTPHPQHADSMWQLTACTGLLDYAPPELNIGGVVCVKK